MHRRKKIANHDMKYTRANFKYETYEVENDDVGT
jgi:hypothetical protein